MERRKFLENSGLVASTALLAGLSNYALSAPLLSQPYKKKGDGDKKVKIGLYSISYLGIWYDGPALTWEEMVGKAREFGYDGIELDNKRPLGNPMDLDQRKRDNMRNIIEKAGMEVPCVAANNDFSSPIPEHRECQLLMVRETARLAKDLGSKMVRLFAAWPGVPIHNGTGTYEFTRGNYYSYERQYPFVTRLDRWNLVKEGLKEAAAFGEEFGVIMALQNHKPLIRDWWDTYDMVKEVDSPWLKVCLDAPIMTRHDKEWVEEAVNTVGEMQVHSHFGGEYYRDAGGNIQQRHNRNELIGSKFSHEMPDYEHYMRLMKEIGYEGYFTYELCHSVLDENHKPANLDYVHTQVRMAQEYMQRIIDKTYPDSL